MKEFSCLMSCFYKDDPFYLEECLNSLVSQSLQASQLVLVEDGPIGLELSSVIERYQTILKIERIKLDINQGLGKALNIGLEHCSNDIVFRMDTDDIAMPNRFEVQVSYLIDNPQIDILGSWVRDIDQRGNILKDRTYPTTDRKIKKLIWTNPIIHPAVAYRKKSILNINSYDVNLKRRQDYDLWLRAAKNGLVFENIPQFLLLYRFTPNYYKKNNTKVAFEQVKMGWRGMRGNRDIPFIAYLLILGPLIRSILPKFMIKYVHQLMDKIDPRRN